MLSWLISSLFSTFVGLVTGPIFIAYDLTAHYSDKLQECHKRTFYLPSYDVTFIVSTDPYNEKFDVDNFIVSHYFASFYHNVYVALITGLFTGNVVYTLVTSVGFALFAVYRIHSLERQFHNSKKL
jgi:hypothetical protein